MLRLLLLQLCYVRHAAAASFRCLCCFIASVCVSISVRCAVLPCFVHLGLPCQRSFQQQAQQRLYDRGLPDTRGKRAVLNAPSTRVCSQEPKESSCKNSSSKPSVSNALKSYHSKQEEQKSKFEYCRKCRRVEHTRREEGAQ